MNIAKYRRRSKGWQDDPPAYIHSRILFGAGFFITPKFVQDHEITHVINCAFDSDSPQWFKNKFPDKYICLNAVDSLDANILDWYPVFEKALHTFLREPNSKKVYIHCQCGINRSGFLSLAFMTKRLNIEFETGIAVILAQRPCALTNASYKQQVYQFSEANK